jgi:hypothetical protein
VDEVLNLNFLDFIIFLDIKNGQIRIQMIKFKFKRINQDATPHYRRPAPATGSTAQLGSDVGGTA